MKVFRSLRLGSMSYFCSLQQVTL